MIANANEVKQRHRETLFQYPNVVGVGVGPKLVQGKPTDVMAIKVYVRQKVAPEQLTPEECVPKEIEGIPTDVEIQAPLRAN